MTLTLTCGAFEIDEAGDFRELSANGFRLVRTAPEKLELHSTTGTVIRIRAATPIIVTPEDRP